jgi:hypothetical protein
VLAATPNMLEAWSQATMENVLRVSGVVGGIFGLSMVV